MLRVHWLLISLLLLPGCQKRDHFYAPQQLKPNQFRVMLLPTRLVEQRVTIDVQSTAPIDVYVTSEADESAAQRAAGLAIATRQPPVGLLAGQQQATQAKLPVTIPAEKKYSVTLCNPYQHEAVVTVKVKGE